jgi:hypothetical protein
MRFLVYLYESGIVSAEEAMGILVTQSASSRPLGELAVELKMLRLRDVMAILRAQASDKRSFGRLAVGLGLLTDPQIEELLEVQRARVPSVDQLLLESGHAPEAVKRYRLMFLGT